MTRFVPFRNWSLRAKLAALMVLAVAAPVALSTWLDVADTREREFEAIKSLLDARTEQIAREFDRVHAGYLTAAERVATFPDVTALCQRGSKDEDVRQRVRATLATFPRSDPDVRGAALLDAGGRVALATNPALEGADFSRHEAVQAALGGARYVHGVYLSATEVPSVAYVVPVREARGEVRCAVAIWVSSKPFESTLRSSAGLAGAGSYAVMFDNLGIRIAHSLDDSNLYHPAGPLAPDVVQRLVRQARFGGRTAELLRDVRPFPEQFARARDAAPDRNWFRGFSPANAQWNLGVARRLSSVPWTVFYMVPEQVLQARTTQVLIDEVRLSITIVTIVALAAALFAAGMLGPIRVLRDAVARLASDPGVRVPASNDDELGELATAFNAMAERLQSQDRQLRAANENLEEKVRERTAELRHTTARMEVEMKKLQDAEELIRENERLMNAIIDNTGAVIYVKDLDGRLVLVNQRYLEVFKVSRERVIGKTDFDVIPAEAAAEVRRLDEEVARSSGPLYREEEIPQDDGVHTYISVKSQLRDASGKVTGIFGVSTDITARKQLESRQRAQLGRLHLLDQITTLIAQREDTASLYQTLCNSLEERMPIDFACVCVLGDEPGLLRVKRVGALSYGRALAMSMAADAELPVGDNGLARCIAEGQLVYEPRLARSTHAFPARLARAGLGSLVIAPLMSEGRVFGLLIAAREQTDAFESGDCEFLRQLCGHASLAAEQTRLYSDLRRTYEDLRVTQQAALQQERLGALGQMASGIAHDINNAISPVAVYAEALLEQEPGLSPRARSYLEIISRSIDDVAATVARMREFYRTDTDDQALSPVDLAEMARQVADLTRARWSDQAQQTGRSVTLNLDLADGTPNALAVPHEVREALVNLVLNAVDAMPEGGTLTLRCGTAAHASGRPGAFVEVGDTGVGMDEETRRRCLEPFFTTKGQRGTGLGLAMVYGIAQRNGADIDIDSAPGRGTRVRLVFAAIGDAPPPQAVPEPASPRHSLRVLVVDDDPLLQQSIAAILEVDDHRAVCAGGGQAGIDIFMRSLAADSAERFDLVISDLGMPEVGGHQVAAAIKQASPRTPVILLTGWGQRLLDEGQPPPNVDRVLSKPPKLAMLRAALAALLPAQATTAAVSDAGAKQGANPGGNPGSGPGGDGGDHV